MVDAAKQRWTNLRDMDDASRRAHVQRLQREAYARRDVVRKSARPPDVLSSLTSLELAYMAGLIDGEGTICCMSHAAGKTCYPTISIVMTDFGVIEWLARKWNVQTSKSPRRNPAYRPAIFVRVSGERAKLLCGLLLPYLKVKRRQANLVQLFPLSGRAGPGIKIQDAMNARRFSLRDEINGLNHKPRNADYRRGGVTS